MNIILFHAGLLALLIHLLVTLMPILLPVTISFFTSLYDDTFSKKNRKESILGTRGHLSSKLCLSGISFDVWGIVTVLQNERLLPPPPTTKADLGIVLVFFILFHIGFHYLCLKVLPSFQYIYIRLFLVFISIFVPISFLFPTNFFNLVR